MISAFFSRISPVTSAHFSVFADRIIPPGKSRALKSLHSFSLLQRCLWPNIRRGPVAQHKGALLGRVQGGAGHLSPNGCPRPGSRCPPNVSSLHFCTHPIVIFMEDNEPLDDVSFAFWLWLYAKQPSHGFCDSLALIRFFILIRIILNVLIELINLIIFFKPRFKPKHYAPNSLHRTLSHAPKQQNSKAPPSLNNFGPVPKSKACILRRHNGSKFPAKMEVIFPPSGVRFIRQFRSLSPCGPGHVDVPPPPGNPAL